MRLPYGVPVLVRWLIASFHNGLEDVAGDLEAEVRRKNAAILGDRI